MTTIVSERDERMQKLRLLQERGIDPYPADTEKKQTIENVLEGFEFMVEKKETVILAGRVMSLRGHGNLVFSHILDGTGKIQIALSKKDIGSESYTLFIDTVDVGDFIEIEGACFVTHKGEKSVMAARWKMLSKALLPLPEKWHGLQDEEEKLRKRYLDILLNQETRKIFLRKAKFWNSVRTFLLERNFLEVETPVLENTTGGADAKPFSTHHNALGIDVYLRISMGELWQKRLMVAGFEKTFEIGRQFRNEGMDSEHLQDYTQMEFYWAYASYKDGMKLVTELFRHVAQETFGSLKFRIKNFEVNLSKEWERYDYQKTILLHTGIDVFHTNLEEMTSKLNELKIEYDKTGYNITRAMDNLWKYCRKKIVGPGFLVGIPVEISPLAKSDKKNPRITQRFQVILAGSELGNGYSELNDPLDQAERFSEQLKLREAGDEEAQMYDAEFVEALEYGMPPTCGFGMSERVFSFLMNKTMRECQLFPLLRPRGTADLKQNKTKKQI